MVRVIISAVGVSLLGFFSTNVAAQSCSTQDFWTGIPTVYASQCLGATTKNNEIQTTINNWLGENLTLFGKYDKDAGTEVGSLVVNPTGSNGFAWSFSNNEGSSAHNAVFVVKQANVNSPNNDVNWVAYAFQGMISNFGGFFTQTNFGVNDYSHVDAYGTKVYGVPEIDGSSAGIALALLLSLVALFREQFGRRRVTVPSKD